MESTSMRNGDAGIKFVAGYFVTLLILVCSGGLRIARKIFPLNLQRIFSEKFVKALDLLERNGFVSAVEERKVIACLWNITASYITFIENELCWAPLFTPMTSSILKSFIFLVEVYGYYRPVIVRSFFNHLESQTGGLNSLLEVPRDGLAPPHVQLEALAFVRANIDPHINPNEMYVLRRPTTDAASDSSNLQGSTVPQHVFRPGSSQWPYVVQFSDGLLQ